MYIALLIKHWKSILIICCFIVIAFLATVCVIQHKEISTHVQNIKNVNVAWELKIKQLNNEGIALQREYDLLEQQHKTKVEALNEKRELAKGTSIVDYALHFGGSVNNNSEEIKKAEGVILGRPIGSKSVKTKLTGQESKIKGLLNKKVSHSAISRILNVHRLTVTNFVRNNSLNK